MTSSQHFLRALVVVARRCLLLLLLVPGWWWYVQQVFNTSSSYDHGCTFVVVVRTVPYLDIYSSYSTVPVSSLLLVWLHSLLTTGFACS